MSMSAMSCVNPRLTTAQGGEVGAVLRERVRRKLPASLTHRVRYIEHRVVLDLVLQREGEDRQLVASRQELERA